MPVSRLEVRSILESRSIGQLSLVAEAGGIRIGGQEDPEAIARKIVRALWWRTHSPVGLIALPDTLDALVDDAARRLGQELPEGDAWVRLDALTRSLLPALDPGQLQALEQEHAEAMRRAQWPAWVGLGGAGVAAGAGWGARGVLQVLGGSLGRVLPWIPKVGPALVAVRGGARLVATWSSPVGIALTLASVNSALGPERDRALPLLVGVGLLAMQRSSFPAVVVPTTVQPAAGPA